MGHPSSGEYLPESKATGLLQKVKETIKAKETIFSETVEKTAGPQQPFFSVLAAGAGAVDGDT